MGEAAPASVWLVDKPAGPTSHDIVAIARRRVGRRVKVGHGGTLDPFATGLLVVLVGRATRLARFISGLDKTYEAELQLGASSASGDPEGPIARVGPPPTRAELESTLAGLRGAHEQAVPALSAVKVDGVRLYRRTRRGESVETPRRPVRIDELELLSGPDSEGRARIRTRVSSGTYIRQLAVDIGSRIGCGAYCAGLRRIRVGDALDVADANPPEEVREAGGIGLARALSHLPERELSHEEALEVSHGRRLSSQGVASEVALTSAGSLCGVGHDDGEMLRPLVVLS